MRQKLNKNDSGFTIIEVLIVLAIAGLIMLIVFLAVPALQRNSRNTGRRNDAGRIASAVNNFVSNGGGALPLLTGDCATIMDDAGSLNQFPAYTGCTVSTGAPGSVAANTMYLATGPAAAGSVPAASTNVVVIVDKVVCNGTSAFTLGTARQAVEFYTLETGSGNTWSCLSIQ